MISLSALIIQTKEYQNDKTLCWIISNDKEESVGFVLFCKISQVKKNKKNKKNIKTLIVKLTVKGFFLSPINKAKVCALHFCEGSKGECVKLCVNENTRTFLHNLHPHSLHATYMSLLWHRNDRKLIISSIITVAWWEIIKSSSDIISWLKPLGQEQETKTASLNWICWSLQWVKSFF